MIGFNAPMIGRNIPTKLPKLLMGNPHLKSFEVN